MLKRFLELFSCIIDKAQEQSIVEADNEIVAETVRIYPNLSEEEETVFFDIIKGFGDQGYQIRLYFEFLCLHFYKDKRYADDILDCLLTHDIELSRRLNYFTILVREAFMAGVTTDYVKSDLLEKRLVEIIRGRAATFPDYLPYRTRNSKLIVIVIRPFLGEYHSPSLQTINLDNYLRKLGYETIYISFSDNNLLSKYAFDTCAPFERNALFTGINRFEYSCFDMTIKGLHFDLRPETLADDVNALAVYIAQINPEFVIGIEGCNILADICTLFTDVITMNVVDDLPVTLSDCVLRYFPGEYGKEYLNAVKHKKTIFEAKYDNELMPYNDKNSEAVVLEPGKFHICIMGNRLDDDIDGNMLDLIRSTATNVPATDMVFIGKCPKTEERLSDISDRCRFLGYVDRCEDAVAACDLFLNTSGKGGGGGGYMAIKRSVPVYTLKDCDVASVVGEEFVHDSYEELISFVRKLIDNKEFREQMRTLSGENFRKRYSINSIENIAVFCEKYTKHISEHE